MKKHNILIVLISLALWGNAQVFDDALRYSQSDILGTARYSAMGGAFGALGGDISAISDNPATLGTFMFQEFNVTTDFRYHRTATDYRGINTEAHKLNFGFNNIGYVGSFKPSKSNNIKAINMGITYRKMDHYAQRIYTEGFNDEYSITEHFADMAYGTPKSELDNGNGGSDMIFNAYNAYLIDPVQDVSNNTEYKSVLSQMGVDQIHSILKRGRKNEFAASFGINLQDQFYFGAALSLNSVRYIYESEYQENDNQQLINNFDYLNYREKFTATGFGYGLKLGAVIKATPWLKAGLAFHTPTIYSMSEAINENKINSQVLVNNLMQTYSSSTPNGLFYYSLITPLKTSLSVGFIIHKKAMIGIDYELVPYQTAKFMCNKSIEHFNKQNRLIKEVFTTGHNIKFGAEYRFSIMSLRAGFAYLGSPYKKNEINHNAYTLYYSGGLGINWNYFYLDFAYSLANSQNYYYAYNLDFKNVSPYIMNNYKSNYMITIGFRF